MKANQRTAEQSIKILEQAEKGSQTILEQENTRLKRLLAERLREMDDLKESYQRSHWRTKSLRMKKPLNNPHNLGRFPATGCRFGAAPRVGTVKVPNDGIQQARSAKRGVR